MEDLVLTVSEKTGLPEEQARAAAAAVLDYVKAQLPEPLAGQFDAYLANPDAAKSASDLMKGLGGMMGR
jgi:hypothetical protein